VTEPKKYGLKPKAPVVPVQAAQTASGTGDIFQTPPAGRAKNRMPLPPGEIVKAVGGYTDEELATLRTIPDWTPEKGVPSNLPDLLEPVRQTQEEIAEDMDLNHMSPPVPMDTPPLKVPRAVDISKLPPDEQERILGGMREAEQASARRSADQASLVQNLAPGASGINEAISGRNVRDIDITDDRKDATYAGTDTTKTTGDSSRTGGTGSLLKQCPHCHWELNQPDIPDPDIADRQLYLQSLLGEQPFQKQYRLLGGALTITFRELSPREIDLCYKQAHLMRKAGKLDSYEDFFEVLTRFRICLQLVQLGTPETVHNFPTSAAEWAGSEPVETPTETVLPRIEESLYADVIKTETLNTLVGGELSRFNRLLAKLAANSHNENFWSATEQAS